MIIACPECDTKYNLPDEKVATGSVKVKCKKCEHVFVAKPPEPEPDAAQAEAPEDDFGFDDQLGGGDEDDSLGLGDDFAAGQADEDDGLPEDDFGFGDDLDAGSPAATDSGIGDDPFDFGDEDIGTSAEGDAGTDVDDDFDFGDDFDEPDAEPEPASSADSAVADPLDDDFDFGDDFGEPDAEPEPVQSETSAPAASEEDDDLDALFDEDREPVGAATDDLDDAAFSIDDDAGDDVYYDEDFQDEDFEAEVERQVEGGDTDDADDTFSEATDFSDDDDDDPFADDLGAPESDDDLITTLEQLSKTAEKKRFPVLPIVGGVVVVVAVLLGALFFVPDVTRSIPGVGPLTLQLHEALETEYYSAQVLAEIWGEAQKQITTWIPTEVESGHESLRQLLANDNTHAAARELAGRSLFFLAAIAKRPAPGMIPGDLGETYEAYRRAVDGKTVNPGERPDQRVAVAWSQYKAGEIDPALATITDVITAEQPVGMLAALAAARIYEDLSDPESTLEMLNVARRYQANHPWIGLWHLRASWELGAASRGVLGPVVKQLEPEIKRLPSADRVEFYRLASRIALTEKDMAVVSRYLDSGLAISPEDGVLLALKARYQMLSKRWADAAITAEKASKQSPDLPEAKIVHALALAGIGQTQEGIDLLRAAVRKYPQNPEVHLALIDLFMDTQNFEQAEEAYQAAETQIRGNAGLVKRGAEIALKLDSVGLAQERLAEYQAAFPDDAGVMLQLADINLSLGRLSQAEAQLRELVQAQPDHLTPKIQLGEVLLKRDKYKEAEAILAEALSLDTQMPKTYVLLAKSYLHQGLLQDADQATAEALKLAPNLWPVHLLLGQIRLAQDRPQEAVIAIEKAVQLSEGDIEARMSLAQALEALNRPGQAVEQYDLILESDPDNATALQKAAMGYIAVDDWRRSLQYLERWNAAQPSHGDPYLYLGRGRIQIGDLEAARKILERGVKRFPSSSKINSELGWAYLRSGDKRNAQRYLKQATTLDPSNASAQYRLGFLYKEQDQTAAARRAFQKALRLGGLTDVERLDAEQALKAMTY